jgi:hypothetical protein
MKRMKQRQDSSDDFDILDSYGDGFKSPAESTISFDVMKEYLPLVNIDLDDLSVDPRYGTSSSIPFPMTNGSRTGGVGHGTVQVDRERHFSNQQLYSKSITSSPPQRQKPLELLQSDLVPTLHEGPKGTGTYHYIIQEAVRKQKEAQDLFRQLDTKVAPLEPLLHPPPSTMTLPPPPEEPPMSLPVPRRQVGSSIYDPKKIQEQARNERLASLGIFEVQPKASRPSTASFPETIPLNSFSTPPHQKPVTLDKIGDITGPTLISTSSKIETVPISEILKDLKAAGRLVEEKRGLMQFFKK